MDPYEYLTVFVSVILGLAVVHLLSGVALIAVLGSEDGAAAPPNDGRIDLTELQLTW